MAEMQRDVGSCDIKLLHQRKFFIDKLLQAEPSTAMRCIPGTNRLPLTEGIDSGLSWHIAVNEEVVEEGPLQALWKAAPDALYEKDPVSGLWPFLLAASVQYEETFSSENDVAHLDTIYALLRLDPRAVSV
jgi:hypothetical protein